MVAYTYVVEAESYDYFGGHRLDKKRFNTLMEAWATYVKWRKYDRYYDDGAFYRTHKPRLVVSVIEERQPKHGRVLGHKPTKLSWDELPWQDEDIII